ncbi:protein of unknown function [Pararobbsia alpina]
MKFIHFTGSNRTRRGAGDPNSSEISVSLLYTATEAEFEYGSILDTILCNNDSKDCSSPDVERTETTMHPVTHTGSTTYCPTRRHTGN